MRRKESMLESQAERRDATGTKTGSLLKKKGKWRPRKNTYLNRYLRGYSQLCRKGLG